MGRALRANSGTADAWVEKHLASDQPEVWVTIRMLIQAPALALFQTSDSGFLISTIDGAGAFATDFVFISNLGWVGIGGDGNIPPPTANVWQTLELHHINGGASEVYVDGTLVTSGTDGGTGDTGYVRIGLDNGVWDPVAIVYVDSVKVGTTQGDDDLFSDDFESGTFAAWTSTSGDVSIVSDLFTPEGVCIALYAATMDPHPLWTRLDDPDGYNVASSWSIHRGKASGFEKTGTGIASISFKDATGLLDPTNTTSPFYNTAGTATYLDPMRQVVITMQNPVTGTWWPLFTGFLSSQDHDMHMWQDGGGIDNATWECADAFDVLAAQVLTPTQFGTAVSLANFTDVYYQGTPSNVDGEADAFVHVNDRIGQILDDAQWSLERTILFSGNDSVQGRVYDRTDQVLSALFDAADAESVAIANIYADKSGNIVFHGRFPPFFPTDPQYGIKTFNAGGMPEALADPTVAPISGLQFRRAKDDIVNSVIAMPQQPADVTFTDAEVAGQLVQDTASIATFGYRGESFTDLQVSAGHTNATPTNMLEEAKKQGEYIVGNYAQPKTVVSVIQFRTRSPEDVTGPALWEIITEVEIGDRVQLETTHVGGGGFSEYFFVQGIRYEARGMTDDYPDVTCELEVIPASYYDYNPFGTVDGTA